MALYDSMSKLELEEPEDTPEASLLVPGLEDFEQQAEIIPVLSPEAQEYLWAFEARLNEIRDELKGVYTDIIQLPGSAADKGLRDRLDEPEKVNAGVSIYIGDLVEEVAEAKRELGVRGGIDRADYSDMGIAMRALRYAIKKRHELQADKFLAGLDKRLGIIRIFGMYESTQLLGDLAAMEKVMQVEYGLSRAWLEQRARRKLPIENLPHFLLYG